MEEIPLMINGKSIVCRTGASLLEAALDNGIKIPTLCHHHHLESVGACRLCIVEEEKSGRILASCVTPISPGMVIQTDTPTVHEHRKNIIRLMMANHPESCILCNQGNRCKLREIAADLGIGQIDLYPMPHYSGFEAANPFIIRDLTKCILCGRCIRADHDLVMVGAIDYNGRGFESRPATAHVRPLEASSCTFCGTCVSLCPTGALLTKNTHHTGSPQREKTTVCGFCGVGCSLVMGTMDNQIVDVNPSHSKDSVNRSSLCVRGHFAHDFLNSSRRLDRPLIRKNNELVPVTWKEALQTVSERLLSIKKKDGPQSIGLFGSSKCSVEENYLFRKLSTVMLGTNNIDNGGTMSGQSIISRFSERLDGGGRISPLDGLEKAEAIFALGVNATHSLPVLGYALKKASRKKDIPLIVADPRKTDLVPFSTLWLSLESGSDQELINGIAAILYNRNAINSQFIQQYTTNAEQYFKALSSYRLESVSMKTGIALENLERSADILTGKKTTFLIGHGILQQKNGFQTMDALLNLALLTGNMGSEGRGFHFLAAENNEMGAGDMGAFPDRLPGRQPLSDISIKKQWEHAWDVKISPDPGLNIIQMIEEAVEGNLKALYIMGENPVRSFPQPGQIKNAFDNLEFLVVQDILENETTRLADVVLPGAAFSEKEGAFTNLEGRIQCFEPAVFPPGDAKPDWEILDLLSCEMGYPKHFGSIEKVRAEIRDLIPMYSDLREDEGGSWVREGSNLAVFNSDRKGELIPFSPISPSRDETSDPDYPTKAILGSLRYHLGSGTRTNCSERINGMEEKGEVEISFDDGLRLGIHDGTKVRISSLYGSIERTIKLVQTLKSGSIFVPKAFNENDARYLLALTTLEATYSPGMKEIDVKINIL